MHILQKYSLNPSIQASKYPCEDLEKEKTRNRHTLHTLLEQNPASFKGICFTCDAMITTISENRASHYPSCNQCSKKSSEHNSVYDCEDRCLHASKPLALHILLKRADAVCIKQTNM